MTSLELQALLQFRNFYLKDSNIVYSFTYNEVIKNAKTIGTYKLQGDSEPFQIVITLDGFEPVAFHIDVKENPLLVSFTSLATHELFMELTTELK